MAHVSKLLHLDGFCGVSVNVFQNVIEGLALSGLLRRLFSIGFALPCNGNQKRANAGQNRQHMHPFWGFKFRYNVFNNFPYFSIIMNRKTTILFGGFVNKAVVYGLQIGLWYVQGLNIKLNDGIIHLFFVFGIGNDTVKLQGIKIA